MDILIWVAGFLVGFGVGAYVSKNK